MNEAPTIEKTPVPLCRDGKPCPTPPCGGACAQCGYPVAYAHPDSVIDAFRVDAVWIGGTAIWVKSKSSMPPGIVGILQGADSYLEYQIPRGEPSMQSYSCSQEHYASHVELHRAWTAAVGTPGYKKAEWTQRDLQLHEGCGGCLVNPPPLPSERALMGMSSVVTPSTATALQNGLDVYDQRLLLQFAASLLNMRQESTSLLATALIEGIAALSKGWLSASHREVLVQFQERPDCLYKAPYLSAPFAGERVRRLLTEVDRLERLYLGISGIGLVIDDNRHNLDAASLGPFSKPLSQLRIALLPGEADHVELYDIRVGERQNCPIGVSMIHRLSIYTPKNVREIPEPVNISGAHVGKYLPGALLTGKLREEAHSKDPARLFSDDLLGGVEINLGRTFPPMSYVYLYYRVAPGHVFCAVVEPLKNEPVS